MVADGVAAGGRGRATVIAQRMAAADWIRWTLRLLLSGVFAYAGALKMRDASAFAESIASFRLLPDILVTPVALTLPPLEITAAMLALGADRWRRAGAFCLLVLLLIFTAVLSTALARGLQVDCGCFGPDRLDFLNPMRNLWLALGRDVALAVVAWFLYVSVDTKNPPRQRAR